MMKFLKQPFFVIGLSIILFFLIGSFVYEAMYGNIPKQTFFIEEDGRAIEGPPISPRLSDPVHIVGTDQYGYDQFGKIMLGAKYTILAAMAVAFVRMLLAVPLGFILGTYLEKHRSWINGLIDPFHYVPMTIFAYLLLYPILWEPMEGFSTTLTERMLYQIVIMAVITFPIVASLIGNETNLYYHKEYIEAAKTLGAGKFRIIVRHIFPQMREKIFVLYGQQVVETLVVFGHLGLLELYLGGTDVSYDPLFGDPPQSMAYEWAGLFGSTFRYLQGAPWLPLGPAIAFGLVIIAIAAMIEGYTRATNGYVRPPRKRKTPTFVSEEVVEWNVEQLKEKLKRI